MSGEKTKIKFHVVNSIKGGAGKSTFALMLANYLIKEKDKTTYIVDLDLQGSSWEEDFSTFWGYEPLPEKESVGTEKTTSDDTKNEFANTNSESINIEKESVSVEDKDKNSVSILCENYLNDLMYDIEGVNIQKSIRYIRTTTTSVRDIVAPDNNEKLYDIPVYIANPSIDRVDDVQADLFLNAIYKLIDKIKDNHRKDIHIVFDMPPSKDKYAEKVLTHLLLDLNSSLYKKLSDDYILEVELYMLTNLTNSHSEKNVSYLKSLARNRSFSEIMTEFIKNGHFSVFFIYNDVSGIMNKSMKKSNCEQQLIPRTRDQLKRISLSTQKNNGDCIKLGVLEHMDFLYKDQIWDRIVEQKHNNVKCLLMDNSSCDAFKKLMENEIDTDKK